MLIYLSFLIFLYTNRNIFYMKHHLYSCSYYNLVSARLKHNYTSLKKFMSKVTNILLLKKNELHHCKSISSYNSTMFIKYTHCLELCKKAFSQSVFTHLLSYPQTVNYIVSHNILAFPSMHDVYPALQYHHY